MFTYTVQPGDTLNSIAARFNTTPAAIIAANGLQSFLIFPGQRLLIPGTQPGPGPQPPHGNLEQRVNRLENQVNRQQDEINRLQQRVSRLEQRVRRLDGQQ
ncbi:LysM peptidoglycan-binding domain-containing protein [Paenibacillus thermoaerophilus]|uniref:LysM peptidoglycan-binding domain-containing protein n=1 Tax=Paenibacillus thermoaerophilus TaxID=1215385 RepID=A0ABW2UZI7_9BACL|nr:LysM peptidoglycan-binding domain-containing protein [Paenibacillus thermoaerophilus]TMV14375.1 LysM peptidoglycan-binding domain-containing protein [Paenibacillus thermoaerophilus]